MSAQVTPPEAGASPPTVVSLGSSLIAGPSSVGGEQLPGVAEALQGVGPAVLQVDAGAGDQVPDGPRDQALPGPVKDGKDPVAGPRPPCPPGGGWRPPWTRRRTGARPGRPGQGQLAVGRGTPHL